MNDLLRTATLVAGPAVTAGAACAVLAYAWRATREPWLGWLLVVWLLWVVRYALSVVPELWPIGDWATVTLGPAPAFVARDAALVMAMHHLGARWARTVGGVALLPLAVGVVMSVASGTPPDWVPFYLFTAHGLLWIAGAVQLARSPRLLGGVGILAAGGMVAHAFVVGLTPWLSDRLVALSLSYGLSSFVHLAVALGVGIGVRQRLLEDRYRAQRRTARALEFVVRGMVPMCAYCRSVRDATGAWTTLEAFVAQQTATEVQDVRCPACRASPSASR